jgi:UDP-3-O-[3-hydroxymyristoyl] glucosamine N-acyltransferase
MLLRDLAERLGGQVEGDAETEIRSVAPIDTAGPGELTFLANRKYASMLETTKAAAVLIGPEVDAPDRTIVRCADPYVAFVSALAIFDDRPRPTVGIDPLAAISPTAKIAEGASIGAYAVIGDDVIVGANCVIHPHVVIYPEARIGTHATLHAGAVIRERVVLGDGVTLQPGAVIGADGFGFLPDPAALPIAIAQVGNVVVGDHVDVGANSTVDRAAIGSTTLEEGVKIDNLVMIAHGCRIGEASMLAAQVGLAGSTTLGKRVVMGGQVGAAGHVHVGDGARIAAQGGVTRDIPPGETVAGTPALKIGRWRRSMVLFARLPELLRRLRRVEEALSLGEDESHRRER